MVNSEALGAASLLPGSYPQRLGRRLGAEVELTTRDGNRSGVHGRAGLSGTSANAIVEGPLAGGKGAWVASVRRSYLDFLLDRIDPEGSFGFGFSDALGKVTFDVNPRHQLQLLTIAGRSTFDEAPEDITVNDEAVARSRGWLAAATWRFTPGPRLAMTQRVYATGMRFRNVNEHDTLLDGGEASDLAWRADVTLAPSARWIVDVGGDVVRTRAANTRQRTLDGADAPQVLSDYTASGRAASAYAQITARLGRLRLAPGARFDYWQPTDTTTTSPWITGELDIAGGLSLRGGGGVYRQFPALTVLNGLNGNPNLRPERATHADLTIAQALPNAITVQITGFRRDERDVLWAAGSEPRALPEGGFVLGRGDAQWSNRLTGRARGIEATAPARCARRAVRVDRLRVRRARVRRCGERRDVLQRLRPAPHVLGLRALPPVEPFEPRREVPVRQQLSDHRLRRRTDRSVRTRRRCLAESGRSSSRSPMRATR